MSQSCYSDFKQEDKKRLTDAIFHIVPNLVCLLTRKIHKYLLQP